MADEFNNGNMNNNQSTGETGNGSYQYSNDQGPTYQSSYSSGYNTNGTNGSNGSYQSSYSSSNGGSYNGDYHYNSGNNGNGGKKHGNGGKIALAVILAAAVGVAGGVGVSTAVNSRSSVASESASTESAGEDDSEENKSVAKADENDSENSTESSTEDSSDESGAKLNTTKSEAVVTDVTQVVEDVMPSVVSVYNNFTQTGETFFGQTYSQEETATGTGFIISEDKNDNELLIATNNHVVENADSLEVQFIDESTAKANIKGTDESNDLAVIAVNLHDLDKDTLNQIKVATLGDSDTLKIGEPVVAIGNALGYGQSVTTGVVSALNREIQSQDSETGDQISGTFIQTDAAINPGNSGGPLVDLNGNVIGIDSSKIGGETVEGMGYAIPISRAVPIFEELMTQKTKTEVAEADRGYLGISGISVTSQVASAYNMPEGIYVANIIDGGGAADSDLQKGDIITAIEGTKVDDMAALQKQLTYYKAGEKVTLTVERNNGKGEYEETSVDVTLGDKSAIDDYEKEQQQSQHTYGYNNGGSDSKNGQAGKSGKENSGSDDTESSGSEDKEDDGSENSGNEGSFYSFPFSEFFGSN